MNRHDSFHWPHLMSEEGMKEYFNILQSFPEEFPLLSRYKTLEAFAAQLYTFMRPADEEVFEIPKLFDKYDSLVAQIDSTGPDSYNVYGLKT